MKAAHKPYEDNSQATPDETRQREARRDPIDTLPEQFIDTQIDTVAASPRSPSGSPMLSEEDEEEQEAQPDLMTLRVEYTTLSHQLAQLDANKQAGQWARLYRQVQAAEERLRQAEQTSPSPDLSQEIAKQASGHSSDEKTAPAATQSAEEDGLQEQLRSIAGDLMYWKGGLKVLKQARLPKWRGCFQWQIEAKIEALQTAYVRLRAECAKPDG